MQDNVQFNMPPVLIVGRGSRYQLADQLLRLRVSRVLIVTDPFILQRGLIDEFVRQLCNRGIETSVFSDVQPDPTTRNVSEGLAAFNSSGAQAIVAIGGGSPMDAGKAIAAMTNNPEPLSQYLGYHKFTNAGCPLVLVPTTAGTGSEVTKVAVITDIDRNVKMMMLDLHLQANVAIVDYELSTSMPPKLTAHVGIDTLSHGLEAYVSRRASPLTDPIALSCLRLCGRFLKRAYQDGSDHEAREGMMTAALQGGLAFSNSSVCLIHGMSRPLGAHFHLTHGLSNAVLLPAVTRFSLERSIARYAEAARALGAVGPNVDDSQAAQSLLSWLEELNSSCGIGRMSALTECESAYQGKLDEMAEAAIASGSPANNPRVPSHAEIVNIYRSIW